MIPNATYVPTSLQERAAWMQNFATQFAVLGVNPLGFTAPRVAAVGADNEDFQFLAMATVELEAFMTGFRLYRKALTEGNIGEPTPSYPANPSLAPPGKWRPAFLNGSTTW